MIEVREAFSGELEAAGAATAHAYEEFFDLGGPDEDLAYLARIRDAAGRAARTTILVALLDGAIVGSLTLELDGRTDPRDDPLPAHRAHIRMLGVDPAARTRGAGRALMHAAEERARTAGKSEMTLHTTGLMEAAHGMYGALGYERVPDEIMPDGFVLMGYRKAL
ncbi:MAG: GNAT family N-acetyltransferase [Actinomycetota bacterium]